MIQLHIREHGTHNRGYSFDFQADLNDYSSADTLLEDLYEYTRNQLEERNLREEDYMEEYLITDWEFDDSNFDIKIDEYSSLSRLISINSRVSDLDTDMIKLLSAYMEETGADFNEAEEKIASGDIYYYEGTLEDWAYQMVEEGLFGEISDNVINYIDYEKIARDLGMDGYIYNERFNLSFSYN
jgi:antirestriction protein